MNKLPTIKELSALVRGLKPRIMDDYRSEGCEDLPYPTMDLTVGWGPETGEWSYQTGDNSYTGGAYGFPFWAVATIDRRSNSREVAKELIAKLNEQTW